MADGPHVVPEGTLYPGHEVSGAYCLRACCLWGGLCPGHVVFLGKLSHGRIISGTLSKGRLSWGTTNQLLRTTTKKDYDPKKEDKPENEEDSKNKDNLKNEEEPSNEDDLKIENEDESFCGRS